MRRRAAAAMLLGRCPDLAGRTVLPNAVTTEHVSMPGIASPLDFPVPCVPIDGTTDRHLAPLRGDADVVARSIVTGSESWLRELDTEAARRQGG